MTKSFLGYLAIAAALALGQQQQRPGETPPGEQRPAQQARPQNEGARNEGPKAEPESFPEPKESVTHHTTSLRGRTLHYTATAARMPVTDAEGKTEARMFYVAYTLDNAGPRRPLTFAFNGGPGSATIWLHMGAFGPKRVKLMPNGFMPAPPFEWEDNQNTLLDRSDLVFVDAIGTGYSRAVTQDLGKKFYDLQGDIAAFGEFIRLYLQKNSRWTSPLYLAGESYGTTRAAGLSGYLIDHGIALNGIVLISTILNFQTASFTTGNDLPYILYLPTYTMTALYHHRLAPELEKDPESLRAEVEKWATTDYTLALQKGDSLSAAERDSVADHLSRYTGLPKHYIEQLNLRVDLSHFDTELLRGKEEIVGRLDGRFRGPAQSAVEQRPEFDPSEAAIRPPYTSVFGDYVKQELGFQTDMTYYVLGGGIGRWDYDVSGWSGFADTSAALRHAFAKNPYMHVFIAEGMYDAATPYFAVDYTFDHMGLTAQAHKNISKDHFNAGHMVYIDNASMEKLRDDIDRQYETATPSQ
ncbi:MAG: peptidase S10 [Acidobacteriaceae bacterium]|nr:peptidase S10 [Acidobacteriaceae bacterium]